MNKLVVTPVKKVGLIPPTPATMTMGLERKVSGSTESITPSRVSGGTRKMGQGSGIDGGSDGGVLWLMI